MHVMIEIFSSRDSRLRQLEFVQVVLSAVQGSSQVLKKVDEAA